MPPRKASALGGERLSLGLKLSYSAPAFAGAALAIPIFVFMPKFYSDDVGASLGYVALAIALARAFDAITDPAMGWISDRTQTRLGRRRPWMALGAPLCALAAVALFTPAPGLGPNAAALWFAVTFALYFLFHTVYEIPYLALGSELTSDYHERSNLFGWRTLFMLLGQVAAGALFVWLPTLAGGTRRGFLWMGLLYGGLLVLLYGWLVTRVRERPEFARRESNPFVPGVRRTLRNRPFRILLFSYAVSSLTAAIPGVLAPFYIEYVLQPPNPDAIIGVMIPLYIGAGVAAVPLWVRAARRFGKRSVWLLSFWIGIVASVGVFLLGKGDTGLFLVLISITGTGNGSALLHPAMQADIIDYDELQTGKRREAQYSSFWAIVPKFVAIPSAALPLALLAQLGYVPNQPQSPEVVFAMRALFLLPAIVNAVAWWIALHFPMTEAVHRKILEGVALHARGKPALDPILGVELHPIEKRDVDEETGWFLDHFSPGELRRAERAGPKVLLRDVGASLVLSLAVTLGAAVWILYRLGDAGHAPGIGVTLVVVMAGIGLTTVCFHALRVRPALGMRTRRISSALIRAHLAPGSAAASTQ